MVVRGTERFVYLDQPAVSITEAQADHLNCYRRIVTMIMAKRTDRLVPGGDRPGQRGDVPHQLPQCTDHRRHLSRPNISRRGRAERSRRRLHRSDLRVEILGAHDVAPRGDTVDNMVAANVKVANMVIAVGIVADVVTAEVIGMGAGRECAHRAAGPGGPLWQLIMVFNVGRTLRVKSLLPMIRPILGNTR